jgi:hypothetical protein
MVLAVSMTMGACAGEFGTTTSPSTLTLPVVTTTFQQAAPSDLVAAVTAGARENHRTHLSGGEEVPPRDTNAQGQALFQLNAAGTELRYKLNVANINNVVQAHIHMAGAGFNGGIVVWLYPSAPPAVLIPGRSDGVLAEGVITSASLVNALAGQPLSALLSVMRAGNTYVNVHTTQFPPGEVRGQID